MATCTTPEIAQCPLGDFVFQSLPVRNLSLVFLQGKETGIGTRLERLCSLLDGDLAGSLQTLFSQAENSQALKA